jgi:DNA-directed RNA polymerase III subunit RPC8
MNWINTLKSWIWLIIYMLTVPLYLAVTLGFFDDIYVPAPLMPKPNRCEPDPYNRKQMIWVWEYGEPKEDYIVDDACQIKFRVESISYPSVPTERAEDAKPFAPMVVTVSSFIKLIL